MLNSHWWIFEASGSVTAKLTTLEYEINVPSGINIPPGRFIKNNKHTPYKIEPYI